MSITQVSSWETLAVWEGRFADGLTEAIELACPSEPRLRAALTRIVSAQGDGHRQPPLRLFAMAVHGAVTGDPEPAVPVSVVSSLWWAGAEALDDLSDGTVSVDGLSAAGLLTASIACMTVAPQAYLAVCPVPDALRLTWQAQTARGSLAAAEGQLADMSRDPETLRWAHVMKTYVGKTGAAYERDAVMAVQLATTDPATVRGWRAFGQLFGVLRQVHNDNTDGDPADDEDLANGTPTLLLAHALDVLPPAERDELLALRTAALTDPATRAAMRTALHHPDVVAGYRDKLRALRSHACTLLDQLAGASDYRSVLRSWIDVSYLRALPGGTTAASRSR
jgi:Polyprenyl synthetase